MASPTAKTILKDLSTVTDSLVSLKQDETAAIEAMKAKQAEIAANKLRQSATYQMLCSMLFLNYGINTSHEAFSKINFANFTVQDFEYAIKVANGETIA